MSNWTLSLSDPWFTYMKASQKTFEGRLYRGLPRYFKVGDTIRFYHESDMVIEPFAVEIVEIHRFATFADSLAELPIEKVLPGIKSIEEGTQIYLKFASNETQLRVGVCQIEIKAKLD